MNALTDDDLRTLTKLHARLIRELEAKEELGELPRTWENAAEIRSVAKAIAALAAHPATKAPPERDCTCQHYEGRDCRRCFPVEKQT